MEIKKIGVVGAGQMGSGVAQVLAQAGFLVVMHDLYREQLDRGMALISRQLSHNVEKGLIAEEQRFETSSRISISLQMADVRECHFIVESIVEDADAKKSLFVQLDKLLPPEIVLTTTTSSLSVTALAASTHRPAKIAGLHFLSPVPLAKAVEVVRGLSTSEETLRETKSIVERTGKTPVEVSDYPGFVFHRVVLPTINEATYALMEGVATVEAIDTVVKAGLAQPTGPLELADRIGLDTCLYLLESLYRDLGDPKFYPCPLLRKMVAGGYLGRKTGRGFYRY